MICANPLHLRNGVSRYNGNKATTEMRKSAKKFQKNRVTVGIMTYIRVPDDDGTIEVPAYKIAELRANRCFNRGTEEADAEYRKTYENIPLLKSWLNNKTNWSPETLLQFGKRLSAVATKAPIQPHCPID